MTTLFRELRAVAETIGDSKPYHQATRFPWALVLDLDGRPQGGLVPLWTTEELSNGKKRQVRGIEHHTPSLKRTSGVAALVPHDGIGYVLGWADEGSKPERVKKAHQAWADLVREWATEVGRSDPIAQAVLAFLSHAAEVPRPDEWHTKDLVLLQVGQTPAHLAPSLATFWTAHVEGAKSGGQQGICLVCGMSGVLVDTMPQPVKGTLVPGGQSSGIAPISINETAFGFGLTTGLRHVPLCTACAQAIPTALNRLLSDGTRTERTTDTATTWWITGDSMWTPKPFLDDPIPREVKALMQSVRRGLPESAAKAEHWNSVVLSANGPRLIVRDWTSVPLLEVQANIAAWFDDTETEPGRLDGRRYHSLDWLSMATGRHDRQKNRYFSLSDKKGHHYHGAQDMLRACAIKGEAPPPALLVHLITRITSDQHIDDLRIALLRLVLRRTYQRGDLMPGLDQSCADPCYLAGRLLSLYADIQYAAATAEGGDKPNSSFVDKYLAGAISDPRLALAAGEKRAAAWLNKLRRAGRAHYSEREVDAVISLLEPDKPLPARASLDQQAMFILGYHHQRAFSQQQREIAIRQRTLPVEPSDDTTPTHP